MAEPLAEDLSYSPELRERILAGFRGDVPPLRPALAYRMALVAVACAMVLLPVVYAGLIAAGGWGLWIYGRYYFGSLVRDGGPWLVGALPLFVGSVVLICLVKPLFARPVQPDKPLRLDPAEEPLLFQLVARICAALQAPVPREIHVDCQVNAAAGFRRGLLSLFGNDMVLTIGLPLVQGLSVQQLAGVMAHELGHFSQRTGLRVSYVIRIINFWLVRLVYGRDRFDAMLESAAERAPLAAVRWFFRVALFFVRLSRRFLWALMMLGHMLSSVMMRQMEYDADRYEVRLAGFSSFDATLRELFALSIGHGMAMEDLEEQWKERRLADNFPRLVLANRKEGVRQIAPRLEHYLANEQAERFSTHPTARQRTARALREKGVGVFSSSLPATALFSDFDRLARTISFAFYRGMLGNRVESRNLISFQAVQERQEQSGSERAACERFFQNLDWLRGLPLPQKLPPLPEDPGIVLAELEKARRAVLAKDADHGRESQAFRETVDARISVLRAHAVLDVGFRIRPEEFGLASSDPVTALHEAERLQGRLRTIALQLEKFEKWEVRRLGLALVLLAAAEVRRRVAEAEEWGREVPRLLACGAFVTGRLPRLLELRTARSTLEILLAQLRPEGGNPRLVPAITERLAGLQEQLKELHRELRAQAYPFDHARQEVNLAQIVLPTMPAAGDLDGLFGASGQALERLHEVYDRILGRLAMMAEKVEEALGMPPVGPIEAGPPIEASLIAVGPIAVNPITETKPEAVESREAFPRYFRGAVELRPLPLVLPLFLQEPAQTPAATRSALQALREAVAAVADGAAATAAKARHYREAEQRLGKALRAESLLILGIPLDLPSFGLDREDRAAASDAQRQAKAELAALEPDLRAFEEIQARRLTGALRLLAEPRLGERIPDRERRHAEQAALLAGAAALQQQFPRLRDLRSCCIVLDSLKAQAAAHGDLSGFGSQVQEWAARAHKQLQELQRVLHPTPCPFVQARGIVSLAQIGVPSLPAFDDYEGIFQASARAIQELLDLHRRILGRMALTAEKVEQALELGGR